MPLSVVLGSAVNALIDGHSASNGATIPDTATVALSSSDTSVATVPDTVAVPAGGAKELVVPVTLLATGTCSINCVVTNGAQVLNASDTLTVTAAVVPLDHVTLTLVQA